MKKSLALAGLVLFAAALFAQEQPMPRVELYGGFSQAMADPFQAGTRDSFRGWNAAFDLNAAKWLSLVVEVGGNYGTVKLPVAVPTPFPPCPPFCPTATDTFSVDTKLGTYLFGVHVPYRKSERFVPYASALIGRATVTGEVDRFKETSSGFGMALGGGVDVGLTKRLAWRFQADYLRTDFYKQPQDNYRFQTGIVLRFTGGKKKKRYPDIQPEPTPSEPVPPPEQTTPPEEKKPDQ